MKSQEKVLAGREKSKFRAACASETLCIGKPSIAYNHQPTGRYNVNRTIITLICCAALAPLAFAQPESNGKKQGATTTEGVTVTGTITKITSEEGSAANYQPVKTLVVREDRSNSPGTYVLNGRGHVLNKKGEVIQTAIKPGTHVRIYYADMGDLRMVDRVVVD